MGNLEVVFDSDSDIGSNDPADEFNKQLAAKFKNEVLKIPGGDQLLFDALIAGDITIVFTSFAKTIPFNAQWDTKNRVISIVIPELQDKNALLEDVLTDPPPIREMTFNQQLQFPILWAIIFELCNAANPLMLLLYKKVGGILVFPSAEDYARTIELIEFKSHQRRTELVNGAIKHLNWSKEYALHEYSDQEFDKYYQEIANAPTHSNNDLFISHSDQYRHAYNEVFEAAKADLIRTLDKSILIPPFKLPGSLDFTNKEMEEYQALVTQILLVRHPAELSIIDIDKLKSFNIDSGAKQINSMVESYQEKISYLKSYIEIIKTLNQDCVKYLEHISQLKALMCSEIASLLQVDGVVQRIENAVKDRERNILSMEGMVKLYEGAIATLSLYQNKESLLTKTKESFPAFFAIKKAREDALKSEDKVKTPTPSSSNTSGDGT